MSATRIKAHADAAWYPSLFSSPAPPPSPPPMLALTLPLLISFEGISTTTADNTTFQSTFDTYVQSTMSDPMRPPKSFNFTKVGLKGGPFEGRGGPLREGRGPLRED